MQIGLRRVVHHGTVPAARHDHRHLGLQRQQLFQHAGHPLQAGPGRRQLSPVAHAHLAAAVVTQARCLQDARQQRVGHAGQVCLALQHSVRRTGHTAAHKMGFFFDAVLRNRHRLCTRGYRQVRPQGAQGRCGHIFKLGGDGGAALHQLRQSRLIQVVGLDVAMADQASRAGHVRVEHRSEIAHSLCCVRKHAAELTAAHHAQRGWLARAGAAGQDHRQAHNTGGRVMPRASRVCSAR